nr:Ty3/gypsy retrotransposon protein [Tanacetum cinerariifolium]
TQVRSEDVSGLVGFALLKGDAQIGRGIHQNLLRFLVVLVVVDRFSKYAHFATLPTSFNAPKVAEMFVEAVVKHHGIPKTIVSDRDPIFVSKVWTQLFKLSGTQLNRSTTYHPQTEVVNHRLVPLSIIPYPPGSSKVAAMEDVLVERDELLRQLRDNLLADKNRMEENANLKRRKWSLMWVIRCSSNFSLIGSLLWLGVYLTNWRRGSGSEAMAEILGESDEGFMVEQPLALCGSQFVLRDGSLIKQVLVQWTRRSPEDVTWEYLSDFQAAYPAYDLEDKVISNEGVRRGRWMQEGPSRFPWRQSGTRTLS